MTGFFALFPGSKKVRRLVLALGVGTAPRLAPIHTPGADGVVSSLEERVQEVKKEEHQVSPMPDFIEWVQLSDDKGRTYFWNRRTRATITSCSSLQRIVEQNVDIRAPGGGGRHLDLQGFLPGQRSTALQFSEERISKRIVEQNVDIPGGGLQGLRPVQVQQRLRHPQFLDL